MVIYINGIKATKADILRLMADLKKGIQRATAKMTAKGNFSIKTEL